ncbi:MAG: peroxide stress protein YaaA [Pseudomonadales bacterium]|nr:peroxide stress protein YaaA [Pseudomonadales bacterium]
MLTIISPAKTLDYESPLTTRKSSTPQMLQQSGQLVEIMRDKTPKDLQKLMKISPKLAEMNVERFKEWRPQMDAPEARQALLAFRGDVYLGLKAEEFTASDFSFAQKHLRILSGLYGLLRPLDMIRPYRLEMGIKLQNPAGKDLYDFWGSEITAMINDTLAEQRNKTLINLASNEYAKVVQMKKLTGEVITPVFRDFSNGSYKVLSFFAKKARGQMASYIIRNRINKPADIRNFDVDGYRFSESHSDDQQWVFLRKA